MSHFQLGAPVWHDDFGFGTVLRDWPLCPDKCMDVQFDHGKVEFVPPDDLEMVIPLSERFPEAA